MRPILTLFIFITLGSLMAQKSELNLASDIWPPFADTDGEKAFALELVEEALKRGEVGIGTSIVSFKEVLDGINAGQYDGSATLWKTKDRESYLLYSEPYLENRLVLVSRAGNDVSADSLNDLKNKRVSVVSDYAYGTSIYTIPGVSILPGKSDQQNLELLLEGKTDYMLVDELLIKYLLEYQHQEVKKYLSVGTKAIIVQPLYFAILKSTTNAEAIISEFNENIRQMMADGTYNDILELNWIQYDVDGDGVLELVMGGGQAGKEAPANYYALMSASGLSTNTDRYYINGTVYDGWNTVPAKFKNDLIKAANSAPSESGGLKLKF
ncbi:MAG: transporter substrate-binding domain-containing protein [Flavobacteriaceae bacterium]